jgi:hypothetical protein
MGTACSMHGRYEEHIKRVCLEDLKGRNHLEDLDVDGRMMLKLIMENWDGRAWIALILLRTETSSELL